MAGEIFSFVPSKAFTKDSKPRVNSIQFGDGYSQRILRGINTMDDSWKVSFIGQSLTVANNIVAFFTARGGSEYFLFTPPGEVVQYKVICPDWSVEYTSHISRNIIATFIRVYDIV